jgi:hypothetical protein
MATTLSELRCLTQYKERDLICVEGNDGEGIGPAWGRVTARWPSPGMRKRVVVDFPSRQAAEKAACELANALVLTQDYDDYKEVLAEWFAGQ